MRDEEINEKSKGLYYNVNKRKEAGTSRKKGAPGAPTDQDWKDAAKTAKEALRPAHAKELRNKELNKDKGAPKSGKATGPEDYDFLKYKGKKKKQTNEGLAELAGAAERDHEVQMARADLYKLAKYAIKLHDMLKGVSEAEGLEGWVQSKITKSADMIGSVYHHMDYDEAMDEVIEAKKEPEKMKVTNVDKKANSPAYQKMKKGDKRYTDATTESLQNKLAAKLEGKFKSDAHRKAVHAGKASGKKAKKSLRK